MNALRETIEAAWEDRGLLQQTETQEAIREVVHLCDEGSLRCAEPTASGWQVNEWVTKTAGSEFQREPWSLWTQSST